jgi:hypothetical protein
MQQNFLDNSGHVSSPAIDHFGPVNFGPYYVPGGFGPVNFGPYYVPNGFEPVNFGPHFVPNG